MEKKIYLTPSVEVLEMEYETELLAGTSTTFDPDAPQDTEIINVKPGDEVIIP